MKKNRQFLISGLVMMLLAFFTLSIANAQEEKEEKKTIKIKMVTDDDGNVKIDTTIVLDEDFDGNWEDLIEDEELREKLKDIHINIKSDGDENVYIMSTDVKGHKYMYVTDGDDDGEEKVMVWHGDVAFDGDEDMDVIIEKLDGDSNIMVMTTVKSDCKSKDGKVIMKTIKVDVDDEGENVMIWTSDDMDEEVYEVMIDKLGGDSTKVMVIKVDGDKEYKVVKEKEIIIITDDEDCIKKDKDKKKKKKKEDND